jgi:hypothetical protein
MIVTWFSNDLQHVHGFPMIYTWFSNDLQQAHGFPMIAAGP